MNYDLWKILFEGSGLLLSIIALAWTGYVYWVNRGRARKEQIDSLDGRVTKLEESVKHAPGHADIQRMHDRVSEVNRNVSEVKSDVSSLSTAIGGLRDTVVNLGKTVQLLYDHELQESRDAKNRRRDG